MIISTITIYLLLLVVLAIITGVFIYAVHVYERGVDLAPLHEKKEQLQEDIESAQNTLADLSAQVNMLRTQEAAAQQAIAEAQTAREWLEANRDRVASLQTQIAHLQEDLQHVNDEMNKRNDEYQQKQLELQQLAGQLQALRMEASQKRKEVEECQTQTQHLQSEITRLTGMQNALREDVANLLNERNTAQSERDAAIAERNLVQQQHAELKNALEQVNNEKLAAINAQIDEKNKQKTELAKDVDFLAQQKGQYDGISAKLSQAQGQLEAREHQWEDLNRVIFKYPSGRNRMNEEEEDEWLGSFKDNLRNCGIVFPERMINAFHTGLKVADYSPLVVLAGISGTGKSLLPRLYAHAMGMNFLQVAVQPRWDSPQDMFGFYNYMEGRFKATELSRLLWQFDRYNNEVAKTKCQNILPMNLVLLDEMNLARVEYYFSDMLSKLEVRRGLNPDDENQRRNAEVEIECGASKKDSEARRLFVGNNTLFVGTMNEDESTQTLSDKVMDRSNVLRFGRPEQLNAAPKVDDFLRKYNARVLPDTIWLTNWVMSDGQNIQDLRQIMESINAELARIGRPFAHRVWQAMKAYVSNYPVPGPNGFRDAVADQIEMKVLPKLNGIEKENQTAREVLENIGRQINKLGDAELYATYENCRTNNSEVFFQWHGVMR